MENDHIRNALDENETRTAKTLETTQTKKKCNDSGMKWSGIEYNEKGNKGVGKYSTRRTYTLQVKYAEQECNGKLNTWRITI